MPKRIAFKVPTTDGTRVEEGFMALFDVGGKRHRFVIHGDTLSDYRSGYAVGSFHGIKIERMARISSYTRTTDRQAAAILLGRIIDKAGLAKVQSELARHPTINP